MGKTVDKYLEEIIEKETKGLWDKAFHEGIMAGWLACCAAMYEQTKELHNVKAYRQFLREKRDEARDRLTVNKSDHTEA